MEQNPADSRREDASRGVVLALEHHLEVARRLHDLPAGVLELAVLDLDVDVAVPLDAGEVVDVDVQVDLHLTPSNAPKKLIRSAISCSLCPRAFARETSSL